MSGYDSMRTASRRKRRAVPRQRQKDVSASYLRSPVRARQLAKLAGPTRQAHRYFHAQCCSCKQQPTTDQRHKATSCRSLNRSVGCTISVESHARAWLGPGQCCRRGKPQAPWLPHHRGDAGHRRCDCFPTAGGAGVVCAAEELTCRRQSASLLNASVF